MPQLLILLAAGAGVFLVRRWYRDEQRRIAAELARARKAMDQREAENVVQRSSAIPRPGSIAQSTTDRPQVPLASLLPLT